ncbi:MAG: helix-turn-helix domain-containing protein [Caulobacterales bacterium]|nr:helix-turn-helix domain-containing protein [Caulobacterales bacterium]
MLSEALRLLRVFHDMKQKEIADKLGVSKSYVSEIENGNRTPSLGVIRRYSEVFRVPVSSIMFFSEHIEGAQRGSTPSDRARSAIASKIIGFLQMVEDKSEIDAA